jgi:hypothetical protein
MTSPPEEPIIQAQVEAIEIDAAVNQCAWCEIEINEGAGRLVGFKLADRS